MAYQDVPVPVSSYFKFKQIKDYIEGFYISSSPSTGQYGGTDVTVQGARGKEGGVAFADQPTDLRTFTAKGVLEKQVARAGFAQGNKLLVGHTNNKPTDKGNDQKIYTVKIDRDAKPAAVATRVAPKPSPAETDDSPF